MIKTDENVVGSDWDGLLCDILELVRQGAVIGLMDRERNAIVYVHDNWATQEQRSNALTIPQIIKHYNEGGE